MCSLFSVSFLNISFIALHKLKNQQCYIQKPSLSSSLETFFCLLAAHTFQSLPTLGGTRVLTSLSGDHFVRCHSLQRGNLGMCFPPSPHAVRLRIPAASSICIVRGCYSLCVPLQWHVCVTSNFGDSWDFSGTCLCIICSHSVCCFLSSCRNSSHHRCVCLGRSGCSGKA